MPDTHRLPIPVLHPCLLVCVSAYLPACLMVQVAEHLGFERIVLNHSDFDRSLNPRFTVPVDMHVPVGPRAAASPST